MKKFSLKKKLLSSAMALGLASGFTFSGANAVEVAADGTGQVLLGPLYVVAARHAETNEVLVRGTTHIRIINPSSTHAVKARIAFRSKVNCTEVLDFILYLSPMDVWRGRLVNVDDQAYLMSEDDSVRNLPWDDSFASVEGKAANVQLFDVNLAPNDYNEMGLFEVIGAYSARGTVKTPLGNVVVRQGMSKFELRKIFDTSMETLLDPSYNNCTVGATGDCVIRTDDPATVQLRGEVSIDIGNDKISYPMVALDQGGNLADINGGKVIANPHYDVEASLSINMGNKFGVDQSNTISDIEAALSANSFISANENNSIVFVSFPTKYEHFLRPPIDAWEFPFNSTGSVDYTLRLFDNEENEVKSTGIAVSGGETSEQSITSCVEWFQPNWAFNSGWYSLDFPVTAMPAWVSTLNGLGGDFFQNSRR